ncbi:MAG: hypothetical protein ACHQ1G_10190 [Planctomycetota bacterium]
MRLLPLLLAAAGAFAGDIVFVDVAVVPMDRNRVLEHRNVVVRDGRIAAIGAEAPPGGATVIDGRGRFLMVHGDLYGSGARKTLMRNGLRREGAALMPQPRSGSGGAR